MNEDMGWLKRDDPRNWTQTELSFMRRNAATLTKQQVADALGRTKRAVHAKAGRMGISFLKYGAASHFTRHGESTLRRIYELRRAGMSHQKIADELGIYKSTVVRITIHESRYREMIRIEAEYERD